MASLTIARARFAVAVTQTGTGPDNLRTPDPKEVWQGATAANSIYFDMGEAVEADTFFVGSILPNADNLTVEVSSATSLGAGGVGLGSMSPGPVTAKRRHAFLKRAPVTSRYWAINFNSTAPSGFGVFAIGKSVQPAYGHEWGSGRTVDDRSDVSALRGGGYGIERGARVPGWQFNCGDLSDAEVASLWDIVAEVGGSAPVVVAEDPSASQPALNNSLHYGLIDRPEAYTREAPFLNSWSFRIRGWV